MIEVIETTKNELIRTKDRMLCLLADTPDDRLAWKPSANSRSILEIVAHSANALKNIRTQMQGTPFAIPTSAEANSSFLEHDREYATRSEAEAYLSKMCQEYVDFLDTLTEADLDRTEAMPFGLGQLPLRYFIGAGNMHTMGHIAQIEYVQTIYGDHDWHAGF